MLKLISKKVRNKDTVHS